MNPAANHRVSEQTLHDGQDVASGTRRRRGASTRPMRETDQALRATPHDRRERRAADPDWPRSGRASSERHTGEQRSRRGGRTRRRCPARPHAPRLHARGGHVVGRHRLGRGDLPRPAGILGIGVEPVSAGAAHGPPGPATVSRAKTVSPERLELAQRARSAGGRRGPLRNTVSAGTSDSASQESRRPRSAPGLSSCSTSWNNPLAAQTTPRHQAAGHDDGARPPSAMLGVMMISSVLLALYIPASLGWARWGAWWRMWTRTFSRNPRVTKRAHRGDASDLTRNWVAQSES